MKVTAAQREALGQLDCPDPVEVFGYSHGIAVQLDDDDGTILIFDPDGNSISQRDIERDELITALRAAWDRNPDQRLGQLVSNAYNLLESNAGLFYSSDSRLRYALGQL